MNKNNPPPIEDQFSETMFALGKRVRQRMDEEMHAAGLSGVQMWALRHLVEQPMGVSRLADCMHSGRSAATQLVDRMVAEGLVRRTDNPNDRRGVLVEITPEGRARLEQGEVIHRRVTAELLAPLTKSECEQLIGLLRRMLM